MSAPCTMTLNLTCGLASLALPSLLSPWCWGRLRLVACSFGASLEDAFGVLAATYSEVLALHDVTPWLLWYRQPASAEEPDK